MSDMAILSVFLGMGIGAGLAFGLIGLGGFIAREVMRTSQDDLS